MDEKTFEHYFRMSYLAVHSCAPWFAKSIFTSKEIRKIRIYRGGIKYRRGDIEWGGWVGGGGGK